MRFKEYCIQHRKISSCWRCFVWIEIRALFEDIAALAKSPTHRLQHYALQLDIDTRSARECTGASGYLVVMFRQQTSLVEQRLSPAQQSDSPHKHSSDRHLVFRSHGYLTALPIHTCASAVSSRYLYPTFPHRSAHDQWITNPVV